jgi:hypothetical protein
MVSFRGCVAPLEVHRGEKWVDLKPPKLTSLSRVRKSLDIRCFQRSCAEREELTAYPITSVWLFEYFMSGKHRQKDDLKDHHSKLIAERDRSLFGQVISSVIRD